MPLQPYRVAANRIKLNAFIYGNPGVGKTTLGGSAQDHPDMRDTLVINVEGGLLSLAGRGDIQAVDPDNTNEIEEFLQQFAVGATRPREFESVNTIVLDSGTEMAGMSLSEISKSSYARDIRRNRNTDRDPNEVDRGDYGRNTIKITRIMRLLRDLPVHCIVTGLPRTTRNQTTGNIEEIGPNFTPALYETIIGYFDFVWYMYQDAEGNRAMLTQQQGVFRAKTRGAHFAESLGPVTSLTNLAEIYDLLIETESTAARVNTAANSSRATAAVNPAANTAVRRTTAVARSASGTRATTLDQARREAGAR